ncbi:MAG: GNAT family N-acetyltransferase [Planctomycetes bacterium]|nr:GNAT family N-acetyltransferase [Planctomycetota bacterium]
MIIRDATEADMPVLCELCAQLGYRGDPADIARWYSGLAGRADHALIVAQSDGAVLGLADLSERRHLVGPPMAELESLVVLQSARGRGVGAALLAAAEGWARLRGLAGVNLGSRVTRLDAHRFYEREGYTRIKEQAIFRKLFPAT